MVNQIGETFSGDGVIGLILAIAPESARFKKVAPQVPVSHDTVSNRVDEARNIGLIRTEHISGIGTSFTNELTPSGDIYYWMMIELGLDDIRIDYIMVNVCTFHNNTPTTDSGRSSQRY
ncbi:hypothetical protein [Halorubrum sp. Atlit-28R]|jgi:DNA-binding HxlR family transcriptional regulator|uniref:hypothetical protein n=1 Tax=Halorubrum sp. Atlit-28R TaxID=2282129 RepID=UPI0011C3621E|nr:hypothetical protein [Halorubrum sp. Atlit-28R]